MENLTILTDQELFNKCQEYGRNARMWLRKFAALLSEVEKRQLWKTYKFYNIYDFAAKLANMNRDQVNEILRVAKKLEDKPVLKNLMESEGWSKLRVVANEATKENDQFLAKKVKEMSKSTLETYIRELKHQESRLSQAEQFLPGEENGIPTLFDNETTGGTQENHAYSGESSEVFAKKHADERFSIRLSLEPSIELRLRELQRKLSREQKSPATFNDVVKFLLEQYESTRITRKKKIATDEELQKIKDQTCASRYIPASVRNLITKKHHGRCAFPNCHKLYDIFHHTRRYSLVQNHDPDFLVPLCKSHEQLAHLGLISNEEKSPNEWSIRTEPDQTSEKFAVDRIVNRYRTPK